MTVVEYPLLFLMDEWSFFKYEEKLKNIVVGQKNRIFLNYVDYRIIRGSNYMGLITK